jgi:RNA polymerase sigma-70 factor (ECF subfamily)
MVESMTPHKIPDALAAFLAGRDDSDLLVRLRRRDPEGAGILYDRYGKPAYALALRVIKDPALAEDIVAESVLKLWNRIPTFKETRCSALGVWFLAITYVQAREYAQQRAGTLGSLPPKESVIEKPAIFADWPRALNSDYAEEIHRALTSLPFAQRQLLDSGFFEAMTHSDANELIQSALSKITAAIP